jgi:hypothetical protein
MPLSRSEQATLKQIASMGFPVPEPPRQRRSFKAVGIAVLSLIRARYAEQIGYTWLDQLIVRIGTELVLGEQRSRRSQAQYRLITNGNESLLDNTISFLRTFCCMYFVMISWGSGPKDLIRFLVLRQKDINIRTITRRIRYGSNYMILRDSPTSKNPLE